MPTFDHAIFVDGPRPEIEDRAVAIEVPGGLVVAVIDGAGGTGNGARAAEVVLMRLRAHLAAGPRLDDEDDWVDFLAEADSALALGDPSDFGEATAVVLALTPAGVRGASVGDSEAWLHADGAWDDLTADQRRKPLLGSGVAQPVGFSRPAREGTLLAGTDGLFKYAPADRLRAQALGGSSPEACRALGDQARLRNGTLQDDATAVLCRFRT